MALQTERLILREFTESDWPAVLACHSAPAYRRFYEKAPCTPADAGALVDRFVEWQTETPRSKFQWAVTLRREGILIGNCGIRKSAADAAEAEIGCELAPEHWGRGYPMEAGRLLLRIGFRDLGLHRMFAHCAADNADAVCLAERLGLRQEGRLRENVRFDGRWRDTLVYGILEQEWAARNTVPAEGAGRMKNRRWGAG